MRLRPHQAALATLEQGETREYDEAVPFSQESAIRFLESFTQQQFGGGSAQWNKWFAALSDDELDKLYTAFETKSKKVKKGQKKVKKGQEH